MRVGSGDNSICRLLAVPCMFFRPARGSIVDRFATLQHVLGLFNMPRRSLQLALILLMIQVHVYIRVWIVNEDVKEPSLGRKSNSSRHLGSRATSRLVEDRMWALFFEVRSRFWQFLIKRVSSLCF